MTNPKPTIVNTLLKDLAIYKRFQKSPIYFIEKMWGLTPQPIKEEYWDRVAEILRNGELSEIKQEFFTTFEKGKHITWQQWVILLAVERALQGDKRRISVRSGHGIGKSMLLATLIIWYLFCFKDAQVPCTAPTSEQMNDILWKELALWLGRLPKEIQSLFEFQSNYLRVKERPDTWFARAKTARKENPEALAGVHGDYVEMIVDEASGVPEEIFNTAEGALTNKNILVLLISNPTRLLGYFYDSHHKDGANWQKLAFNSEESPIVDAGFVQRIIDKHGKDSDEYKIRVKGEFANEDAIDDKGYVPLLTENDLRFAPDSEFVGEKLMGVDPSGEGSNKSIWVVRDAFKAKRMAKEATSTPKSVASKTVALMTTLQIKDKKVAIDNFGDGADVAKEIALSGHDNGKRIDCVGVNVGDSAKDSEVYLNMRAEAYWKLREWIKRGGELVGDKAIWDDLLKIRYRRTLQGKIQIMSKEEMRKMGIESPDTADALMLTFVEAVNIKEDEVEVYQQKPWEDAFENTGG